MSEWSVRELEETLGFRVPAHWDRRYVKNLDELSAPEYEVVVEEDVEVPARNGETICVDVFRPDASDEAFPGLVAIAGYGKSSQSVDIPPQPFESHVFDHTIEAGDIEFFVERGYAFVIADPQGIGKSTGEWHGAYSKQEQEDGYDVVEWTAEREWCDGKVGMSGISYYGFLQMLVAGEQPPHLEAIMPIEACDDHYRHTYRGGVLEPFYFDIESTITFNNPVPKSYLLYDEEELESMIASRLEDQEIRNNSYLVKVLTTRPPTAHPFFFDVLLHQYDGEFWQEKSAKEKYEDIEVPVYLADPWATYGRYSDSVFTAFTDENLDVPKKATVLESHHDARFPYREASEEMLRWYDHWLKGVDTGLFDEPPMKLNIQGTGTYRWEEEWPLQRTEWRELYLNRFGELSETPERDPDLPSDPLVHRPPTVTTEEPSLSYETDPLTEPLEVTGPLALNLHASVDSEDAQFIVKLWDVDATGDRRLVTQGRLKACFRTLEEAESEPWKPVHDFTEQDPVDPEEVYEYAIGFIRTSYVFGAGHRLELEVKTMDPQNVMKSTKGDHLGPVPNYEEIRYDLYRDGEHRSHLLLPVVPESDDDAWVQSL